MWRGLLNLLRFIVFVISSGTLACHVAQIVLPDLENNKAVGNWWPEYVPYTLYYAGSGFSLLSSIILLILSTTSIHTVSPDRFLSVINAAFLIAVVVYNTLKSGTIPWTGNNNNLAPNQMGFATYCSSYDNDETTFYRCWLVNGAWLGVIILAFLWLCMALLVWILRNSSFYDDDYDVYDYKADVPMMTPSPRPGFVEPNYYSYQQPIYNHPHCNRGSPSNSSPSYGRTEKAAEPPHSHSR